MRTPTIESPASCPRCQQAALIHTPQAPKEDAAQAGSFAWCMDCGQTFVWLEDETLRATTRQDITAIGRFGRSAIALFIVQMMPYRMQQTGRMR